MTWVRVKNMEKELSIGIDLGSDSIKVAFAYFGEGDDVVYGKIDNKPALTQIALPALAFYDTQINKWVYGDQVGKGGQNSFITVVKIKSLINLLSKINNDKNTIAENKILCEQNSKCYYEGQDFPKFFFPQRRKVLEDFEEMIRLNGTFAVDNCTPRMVCIGFFRYVKNIIDERIKEIENKLGLRFYDYQISIIHPSSVGSEYLEELEDLIDLVFKKRAHKILSSNKALAIYAKHRQDVKENENFLVFDMAEEDISVTRIGIENEKIFIDGNDGHNDPIDIGGVDIDQAISDYLTENIGKRETIGTPSCDEIGHINERGTYGKQYLLMKDIKKAKIIFSKKLPENSVFNKGVPITMSWDLCIQKILTKEEFANVVGITTDSGVAWQIFHYIYSELSRPVNHNVHKIFLSGGLAKTYALVDYVKNKLEKNDVKVKVCTFDCNNAGNDEFSIHSFEDAVFAPAVGGAIASLLNVRLTVVLSLSYATWAYVRNKKVLKLFARRGDEIFEDGREFYDVFSLSGSGVTDDELFSTYITENDIKEHIAEWPIIDGCLQIGEIGTEFRRRVSKLIDLKTVSGGSNGILSPSFWGKSVTLQYGAKINFKEGMTVDKDGNAQPLLKNISPRDERVCIVTKDGNRKTVYAREIDIVSNLQDFETSQG